jgi:hypothetical protein
MKTFLSTISLFVILGCVTFAQRPITIESKPVTFTHGALPGFVVTIPEVSYKQLGESWIKLQEKGTKSDVKNTDGELTMYGAIIKDITSESINIYSYLKNQDSVNVLFATFELKPKDYIAIDSHNEEFVKTREFLLNFAKDHYLSLAEEQLQTEDKKLKKMQGDLKSLENDQSKLEKMIQSNTTDIGITGDELVLLRTNLLSLNDELVKQTNEFNGLEEGPAKDEKKKYLDDLEKQVKKTNKSIESGEKKIADMKKEIEKAQNEDLPKNLREQEQQKKAINQQSEVARVAGEKVNNIKNFK